MSLPLQPAVRDTVRRPVSPTATRRRDDIEGLRAVAALLIAVYHIWFGTISGGVDVFLLLTGFLITGSLVRSMERDGRFAFGVFWSRIVKRLFPAAAVVLGATLLGAFLFLPRSRWLDVIAEVQAAALYYGNWHLADNAVDYLAQNNAASPVQHFWSLAIQGQFYLLWPLLVVGSALLAQRFGATARTSALAAVGSVFAVSFGYSLWITAHQPVWAYFDTGARLWELALGGLLALLLPYLKLPRQLRTTAGWLGLTALVSCGFLIGATLPFPGYASLWPTLAAALLIVAGAGDTGRLSANRLLEQRPLVWLGGHAYTLFLWHWPVLLFYLEITDRNHPSLSGGFLVLGASFAAALLTSWIIDGGITRFTRRYKAPGWSLAAGAVFVIPVLIAGSLWNGSISRGQELQLELLTDPASYPGAAVHLSSDLANDLPDLPVRPDTATALKDTVELTRDCNAVATDTELFRCDRGDPDADLTIALLGSSHARHWYHALEALSEKHGWRLVTMTKNACQFSAQTHMRANGTPFWECDAWNVEAMAEVAELRPDAVFTLGTLTSTEANASEHLPEGFVERWRQLDELGIDVLAVRDTPRFSFSVPTCVDQNEPDTCVEDQWLSMSETAPFTERTDLPRNTAFLDMTDYLCRAGVCSGVIGNQLVFYDKSHFTHTFSESLAAPMEPHLLENLGLTPDESTTGW